MVDVRIVLDQEANAAYVYVGENRPVVKTVAVNDEVNVDLDADGGLVGVELLTMHARMPYRELREDFNVPADILRDIRFFMS